MTSSTSTTTKIPSAIPSKQQQDSSDQSVLLKTIKDEAGDKVADYISDILNLKAINNINTLLMPSSLSLPSDAVIIDGVRAIVDLKLLNRTRYINKYIKGINQILPDGGLYVARFESQHQRETRFFSRKYGFIFKIEKSLDFGVHRVIPRLKYLNKIYFAITRGKYRILSLAEAMGRIASCGFALIEHRQIDGFTFAIAMKTRLPLTGYTPTYGPIVRLNRIGKNGKIIKVYKFRTMHPFSEFIQDYVVKMNGYNRAGKPANDFRVTAWGRLFRKYWLDELPQVLNVMKGQMRIVGVRPLSPTRFNELSEFLKTERVREKPGCIPPYVSLNMPSADTNVKAEVLYMWEKAIQDNRISRSAVNFRFFCSAVYNILTNRIVSA
jgi:hypothetical protein